jgi:DNA repair protein RecO (recombination protein O)
LREARFCNTAPLHRDFLQPEEAGMIQLLMRMDFPTMHLFRLSHQERNRIVDVLVQYYRLHIPQFPELRSLSVLQELWA